MALMKFTVKDCMKLIKLIVLLAVVSCSTTIKKETPVIENNSSDVFTYKSSLEWIKDLSKKANCVVNNEKFQYELALIESFDFSKDNGEKVLENLLKHKATIRTYKTKNPFSKVIATTYKNNKTDLYLNLHKNPRPMASMINTVVHEALHLAGYSHGNNSSVDKENSVNYRVGKLAEINSNGCTK